MQRFLCLLLLHPKASTESAGVPEGWRMSDRFLGFRFELAPQPNSDRDLKAAIRDKADELFCFGWTQDSPRNTVVGEARCKTQGGLAMKDFLAASVGVDRVALLDYPDTLIRLHFSHFKIVSPGRTTCFREEPHRCRRLYIEHPE